jgi:hypothetical protein
VIHRDCADADADADVVGVAVVAGAGARAPERIGCEIGSGNVFEEVGVPNLCLCLCLYLWLRWDLCSRYLDSSRFLDQRHWVWEMEKEHRD